jgi:hypothetical protein
MNLEQKKIVVCGSFLLVSEEFKKLKSIMDNKKKQINKCKTRRWWMISYSKIRSR